MTKTHVQIPDQLYRDAKALAKAKEWSFAEVVRRGLEYMTDVNRQAIDAGGEWEPPVVAQLDAVDPATLQKLRSGDEEAHLLHKLKG